MFKVLLLSLFFIPDGFATAIPEVIELFDVRTYTPIDYSLRDLVFEARSDGLTKKVKERLVDTKIDTVSLTVYWLFPNKMDMEVNGLPRGFRELKNELKLMFVGYLPHIVPQRIAPALKGYTFDNAASQRTVIARDVTQQKDINRMELKFDKSGKLKMWKTFSPSEVREIEYAFTSPPWGHNKWVYQKSVTKVITGHGTTTTDKEIDYTNKEGLGFPEKITVSTHYTPKTSSKKPKKILLQSVFRFSNYRVNTGESAKHFRKK